MKSSNGLFLVILVAASSCLRPNPKVASAEFVTIEPAECTDSIFNQELNGFRQQMAADMDAVIGFAPERMAKTEGEGLLNTFVAETMLEFGKSLGNIDLAITNKGGLRCDIPQGNITVGLIFELMPFDNKLVILEMSGTEVEALCHAIAKKGGDAVSGISMMMTKNGEAKNIKIGKKSIDTKKTYRVLTTDYLSQGMDGLAPLANYKKLEPTNVVMSQMLIDAIKAKTAKNQQITTTLKHNIYVEK